MNFNTYYIISFLDFVFVLKMEMQLNLDPHLGMKLSHNAGTLSICGVGPGEEQDILVTNLQVSQSVKVLHSLNEGEDDNQTQRYANPSIECLANDLVIESDTLFISQSLIQHLAYH